ncbi:MAG: hypothetical protein AAF598_06190 [Bacteroidota bacterium]
MKPFYVYVFLFALIIASCTKDGASLLTNSTIIRVDDALFTDAPDDAFEISQASIENDRLDLTILYGGGCSTIAYDLVAPTDVDETTNPIERVVRLAFFDEDNCEALIELMLSFDITPLQTSTADSLQINLEGWNVPLIYQY